MADNEVITAIDNALAALKSARKLITTTSKSEASAPAATASAKKTAGRPAGTKRALSEEGRQRIAEGQRKRWAAMKKAARKTARAAK